MQRIIEKQVDELLTNNCIEPAKSQHSAPNVLVSKKTSDVRMCIDYRRLNANSIPDAYPLPRIHHILEQAKHYNLRRREWHLELQSLILVSPRAPDIRSAQEDQNQVVDSPRQEDKDGTRTEKPSSTGLGSWGPIKNGMPFQRPHPFGGNQTEVCFLVVPPEPGARVNEVEDDDTGEPQSLSENKHNLEPWVENFLERELAQFENLHGVKHIAEHVITTRDDRPIKQRYFPKNTGHAKDHR